MFDIFRLKVYYNHKLTKMIGIREAIEIVDKGRYGLKAMFDLTVNYGSEPISLNNIAKRQDISEHYLEQLMAILRLVLSKVLGAMRIILHEASEITVGDILRA